MAATITKISNFFNYSRKRQRCLENVISIDQPYFLRSMIHDLSRTRWVECQEAYETFVLLLPSIVNTFELILEEQQHQQYSLETPWNLHRETVQKTNAAITDVARFSFSVG